MDSRIIGDYDDMGDLIGDDDFLGDLIGDDDIGDFELGARRRKQKRLKRIASRLGMQVTPRASAAQVAAKARAQELRALNTQAIEQGSPMSAGHFVADSGQRELYLPFSATPIVAIGAGSLGALTAVVQRPIMFKRLILSAIDNVAFTDALNSLAVASFLIGVQPVFNASGFAPAEAFAMNAVGNRLLTPVARVGTTVTVNLQRIVAVTNASTVSGYLVGVSADS